MLVSAGTRSRRWPASVLLMATSFFSAASRSAWVALYRTSASVIRRSISSDSLSSELILFFSLKVLRLLSDASSWTPNAWSCLSMKFLSSTTPRRWIRYSRSWRILTDAFATAKHSLGSLSCTWILKRFEV